MGITYEIKQQPKLSYVSGNRMTVCYGVFAYYDGKKEYEQYHCYGEKRGNGEVVYEEGNQAKGPNDGIFSYLGNDKEVYLYFEHKSRNKAKDFFLNFR